MFSSAKKTRKKNTRHELFRISFAALVATAAGGLASIDAISMDLSRCVRSAQITDTAEHDVQTANDIVTDRWPNWLQPRVGMTEQWASTTVTKWAQTGRRAKKTSLTRTSTSELSALVFRERGNALLVLICFLPPTDSVGGRKGGREGRTVTSKCDSDCCQNVRFFYV